MEPTPILMVIYPNEKFSHVIAKTGAIATGIYIKNFSEKDTKLSLENGTFVVEIGDPPEKKKVSDP